MNRIFLVALLGFFTILQCQSYLMTPMTSSRHVLSRKPYLKHPSSVALKTTFLRSQLCGKMSTSDSITTSDHGKSSAMWKAYVKITDTLTTMFPIWTVLFAGLALTRPESFAWFTTKYFTASLGILMLSMGITLTPDDFSRGDFFLMIVFFFFF